ncbi:hypothetical protein C0J52_26337 [Blattella germanica]|nr:hypothetical protein C0J52_26337 [Blattella germanica]
MEKKLKILISAIILVTLLQCVVAQWQSGGPRDVSTLYLKDPNKCPALKEHGFSSFGVNYFDYLKYENSERGYRYCKKSIQYMEKRGLFDMKPEIYSPHP